jgi:hypothetical protein
MTPKKRTVGLAAAALVVAALALLSHVSSWVGHNGDQVYYAATALQFHGVPYAQSLRETTSYFHYPFSYTRLNYGYLNPNAAGLLYPRFLLPLLAAPWTGLMGVRGSFVPGLVMGVLSCLVIVVLAWRRVGRAGALVLPAMLLGSALVTEYLFGIYSETPLVLLTALLLTQLPLGVTRGRWHVLTAAALVPLILLSRQVPLLPPAMVVGGWLWAAVATRRVRNEWLPFVLATIPVTGVTYALIARWAPFPLLSYLEAVTRTSTVVGLLRKLPGLFSHAVIRDVTDALRQDRLGPVLVAVGLVGLVLAVRSPLAGVLIGSLLSGLVTIGVNGGQDDLRYMIPSLPPLALLAAVGVSWGWRRVRRRPWVPPLIAQPARMPDPETTPTVVAGRRWRPVWSAAAACLALGLVVVAVLDLYGPADTSHARTAFVSAANWPGRWPLTITGGTLTCAGSDYQVWLVSRSGIRYAVSGTAMSHSLFTPRINSVRAGKNAYSWPALIPLLEAGMRLCPGNYGYYG